MPDDHLNPEVLDSFLHGALAQDAVARHLAHVLAGCRPCSQLIRDRLNQRQPLPAEGYSNSFLEALSSVVDHEAPLALERIAAPGLAARLHSLTWRQRRLLIANDPRFRTWGLCERLIHESRQRSWELHPDEVLDWARCAVVVGDHLDPRHYGEGLIADLMASVQVNLANAHRLRSEFPSARRCLETARDWLARGSGDELEKARLTSYEASLLVSLGYFEQAVELIDWQCRRLERYSEDQLLAKLMVQRGVALGLYDPAAAVEVQRRALDLIDARKSPRLALCARQGLIWCLNASGNSEEALMLFQASRRLFHQFPDRWAQFHLRWTEARLSFDLGKVDEADSAYQRLWTEAFELDLRLETALVSLDLIEIQLALGNRGEAAHLAGRLIDMFAAWNVHRRAMQAWKLLAETLRQESGNRQLVAELALYLRRAWKNPELEFKR
jgi:tetratricopeptide (TPR) repeat protein